MGNIKQKELTRSQFDNLIETDKVKDVVYSIANTSKKYMYDGTNMRRVTDEEIQMKKSAPKISSRAVVTQGNTDSVTDLSEGTKSIWIKITDKVKYFATKVTEFFSNMFNKN